MAISNGYNDMVLQQRFESNSQPSPDARGSNLNATRPKGRTINQVNIQRKTLSRQPHRQFV